MEKYFAPKRPSSSKCCAGLNGDDDEGFSSKRARQTDANIKWSHKDGSLLIRVDDGNNPNAKKIAAFDLDETLQKTKSGKKPYMTHSGDFTFRHETVKVALEALEKDGYKIVVFSNQGMVKGAVEGKKAQQIRERVELFAKEIEAKFDFYAATQMGEKDTKNYRKPEAGMWREMMRHHRSRNSLKGETVEIDAARTFFVGDAAGRQNDHSADDKGFAQNANVAFFVPELFFEGGKYLQFLENRKKDDGE